MTGDVLSLPLKDLTPVGEILLPALDHGNTGITIFQVK